LPDADTLAEIAVSTADAVRDLGIEPRIAMLRFQLRLDAHRGEPAARGRGNRAGQTPTPDLMIDGEMQADVACSPRFAKSGRFPT